MGAFDISRDTMDENEDTLSHRYLTFHIGHEDYGIEIRYVTEIVGLQKITEVPDMPEFVRGVINLRGQVIPVLDIRLRFKMPPRDYDERTCVIVVNINGSVFGLIVDTVQEVREIPPGSVSPPPSLAPTANSRYILGMGKVGETVKILLDVSRLLRDDELAAMAE
ncbi:chemotaxis protein CheW [Desulfonatronum parangueonense]